MLCTLCRITGKVSKKLGILAYIVVVIYLQKVKRLLSINYNSNSILHLTSYIANNLYSNNLHKKLSFL